MSEGGQVVIFGTGDYARTAAIYLREDSAFEVVAFTVDAERIQTDELEGIPVVPFAELERAYAPSDHAMLVAIGFSRINRARAEVYERCKERGYELITYVNSRATSWGRLSSATTASCSRRTSSSRTSGSAMTSFSGAAITSDTTPRSATTASSRRTP